MTQFAGRIARALAVAASLSLMAPGYAAAQSNFSEADLQSFVTAAMAVSTLIQKWRPQIEAAESQEQAESMLEQADSEIQTAIEKTDGMDLALYQEIVEQLRTDSELSDRVREIYTSKQ